MPTSRPRPPEPALAVNGWFLDQPASGSGQYLLHLLQQLDRLWPGRIEVLVANRAHIRTPSVLQGPSRISIQPLALPLQGPLGKVWFEQVAVPQAAAHADLLHVPYFGAPAACPIPVVVTVHDLIQLVVPRLRGGPLNRLYNLLAAVGARRAATVLADSDHVRRDVLQRLQLPPERVRRVYLAADQRFTTEGSKEEESALLSRYKLEGSFILCTGPLDWRKNTALLIRAYGRSGVTWPLIITGEARSARASSFPDLTSEVHRAGAGDRVRFLGWVDEELKPALYRAAGVFVFPSRYEGFGLPPLEAMASGTPVLCSNATSLPEVVGRSALLFDPEDEEGLASLLRTAVGDDGLRARLRKAGPRRAHRFSWEKTAQETIQAFERVLEGVP